MLNRRIRWVTLQLHHCGDHLRKGIGRAQVATGVEVFGVRWGLTPETPSGNVLCLRISGFILPPSATTFFSIDVYSILVHSVAFYGSFNSKC